VRRKKSKQGGLLRLSAQVFSVKQNLSIHRHVSNVGWRILTSTSDQ